MKIKVETSKTTPSEKRINYKIRVKKYRQFLNADKGSVGLVCTKGDDLTIGDCYKTASIEFYVDDGCSLPLKTHKDVDKARRALNKSVLERLAKLQKIKLAVEKIEEHILETQKGVHTCLDKATHLLENDPKVKSVSICEDFRD